MRRLGEKVAGPGRLSAFICCPPHLLTHVHDSRPSPGDHYLREPSQCVVVCDMSTLYIHFHTTARAKRTFELLFQSSDVKPPLKIDERVREWTYGDYEGFYKHEAVASRKAKGLSSGEVELSSYATFTALNAFRVAGTYGWMAVKVANLLKR
jgi:hypothetical protein